VSATVPSLQAFSETSRDVARSATRLAATVATVLAVRKARARMALLDEGRRHDTGAQILSGLARDLLDAHGVTIECTGRLPTAPAVLVANHVSYLDPLLIASFVPIVPVAKIEAAAWPVLGETMRTLGVLFVDRHEPASGAAVIREGSRIAAEGTSILGFPEGTTSNGDSVLQFYRGLFVIAQEARVPVIPIALRYVSREMSWVGRDSFVPHYLRATTRPSTRVLLSFGSPLDSASFPDAISLATAAHAVVTSLHRQKSSHS